MRLRTPLLTFAALALAACASALAQEKQKEQQVIDDFITTRGVSFDAPGKPTQKQATPPRRSNSAKAKSPGSGSASGGVASGKSPGGKGASTGKSNKGGSDVAAQGGVADGASAPGDGATILPVGLRSLALGYTILMKDDAGSLFATDASREFKTGDHIAVALETNADGYLYLFSAENGRNPELLFPNAQIDGGANPVRAHARASFPTGADTDEQYFIALTDPPATEHLVVIFSRRPLPDVPAGEALVRFCGKNLEDCAWRPTPSQWARITGGAKGRGVTEAKNTQLAQATLPVMPNTLQRGLKVKKEDPKPAVVRVNDSPDADLLVTEIVLTHK
jgi:hypothetical protein